jgi:Mg2+ and Co2+ transporter CorA
MDKRFMKIVEQMDDSFKKIDEGMERSQKIISDQLNRMDVVSQRLASIETCVGDLKHSSLKASYVTLLEHYSPILAEPDRDPGLTH